MARPLRIEYPGAWYHVTCRGNERRPIFKDNNDRQRFLEILQLSCNLFDVEIHAYVLMDNHFHFVLMTHEANLNKFMHRFNTSYTVYFNQRHKRSGHLFQGRYKALLVEADSYLLELSRYVHLNPIRSKDNRTLGVRKERNLLKAYAWSSFKGYMSLGDRLPFVKYEKILGMVGVGDDRRGRRRYADFVFSGIMETSHNNFWERVKGQVILGSDDFVDWVKEYFEKGKKFDEKELPGLKELRRDRAPIRIEMIAREVSRYYGIDEENLYRLYSPCREGRNVFMELCRILLSRSMTLRETGMRLGGVSAAAFSQNRKRLAVRMRADPGLKQTLEELQDTLQKARNQ